MCSVHPAGQIATRSSNRLLTSIKNLFLVPATLGAVTQLWGGTAAERDEVHGVSGAVCEGGVESELARNDKVRGRCGRGASSSVFARVD